MPDQIVVTSSQQLRQCCARLASASVIGFDTEFVGEATYVPELCLAQVATPEALFVIDPYSVGAMDEFWRIVSDPARIVAVHAGREEIRICQRATGRRPINFYDLQIAAGLVGLKYPLSHGALVRELMHARLHKNETLTDWRRRPLTPQQIQYAFDDVRHLLALWRVLSERLEQMNRTEWAQEEFAWHLDRSLAEEPGVERWRKLRGLTTMERKKLAVVQALFAWRDGKAAERNRPARTVLRDDLIVELARRMPHSTHDLGVVRGVPAKDVPEILQVIQTAENAPAESYPTAAPRDDDPAQVLLVAGMLTSVLGDICAEMKLAPNLVANNGDLRQLVRGAYAGDPLPESSVFADGWRKTAVLPHLRAVLQGDRSIRIASLQRVNPFEYLGPTT